MASLNTGNAQYHSGASLASTLLSRKIPIVVTLAIIIIFSLMIAGVAFIYNGRVADLNSRISTLNSQISSLNEQMKDLNGPYLVTGLGIHEVNNSTFNVGNGEETTSNALSISGSITNEGRSTAYDVGLHVVAQDFYGNIVINMTVPLAGVDGTASIPNGDNLPLEQSIEPMQSAQLLINILCQNEVPYNWTISPVCTNSP